MSTASAIYPRGKEAGVFPSLSNRGDEAYVEFSRQPGFAERLGRHPNLVLLRTLSKAWGLAGARVGTLLAEPELVAILRALAPPYPLPSLATEAALRRLQPDELAAARRRTAAVVRPSASVDSSGLSNGPSARAIRGSVSGRPRNASMFS